MGPNFENHYFQDQAPGLPGARFPGSLSPMGHLAPDLLETLGLLVPWHPTIPWDPSKEPKEALYGT